MERRFENIPIFGYLSCYLYMEFADETATIFSAEVDFTKPITQEVFDKIANSCKDYYEAQGKVVTGAKFVTKEEYVKFSEAFGDEGSIAVSWDENGTKITEK